MNVIERPAEMPDAQNKVSFLAAAQGRCPFCHKGKLFSSYLKPAIHCAVCERALATADPGDGPVVFVILIAGFIACGGLLVSFLSWNWPPLLMLMVWPATAVISSLILMPILKALMIASQLKNKVRDQ
jgi:uncharacterized protein (DUF983 family)